MIDLGKFTRSGVQQALNSLELVLGPKPIPSLRLDDFDYLELLRYLRPIHKTARNVGFGVFEYTHGATVVDRGYLGGVMDPTNNRIYFAPHAQSDQASWHYIDCNTGAVVAYLHGVVGLPANASAGAVFSPTLNRIYFAPSAVHTEWLYVDCATGSVVDYTHGATAVLDGYVGGAYCPSLDRIYFTPFNQAAQADWHYVDCSDGSVHSYPRGSGSSAVAFAYAGSVYSPTQNRIYFIPSRQSEELEWHYIDCDTGDVVAYEHGQSLAAWAYEGGVYSPTQNRIYFVPSVQASEPEWHYIDCDTGEVVAYEHGATLVGSYAGGAYDPALNRIWLAPGSQGLQTTWHYIDCYTGDVATYSPGSTTDENGYYGAVYSPTECITYFVPYHEADVAQWHSVQNYSDLPVSRNLTAGPMFNNT